MDNKVKEDEVICKICRQPKKKWKKCKCQQEKGKK